MATAARDQFVRLFTEKIWAMIPETYRNEDGAGTDPGVLRALVTVVAEQAAHLRRSRDRLWDDQYIDLASDWAVPYIAELVGARLVEARDKRARRADVANTIYYRRRNGTLLVLERLIADIAGFEGTAAEMFQRLARAWHRLDERHRVGRVSRTPRGGVANLRAPRVRDLAGGAFDELSYTFDPRAVAGRRGRHGPAKVAFYIQRRQALLVRGAAPSLRPDGRSGTFDPSGRDVQLYAARTRPGPEDYRRAREYELPKPITCRLLDEADFQIDEALLRSLMSGLALDAASAADLGKLQGIRFAREDRLRLRIGFLPSAPTLLAPTIYAAIVAGAMTEDSPKNALYPNSLGVEEAEGVTIGRDHMRGGDLASWPAAPDGTDLVIDPARGRFALSREPATTLRVSYHVGMLGSLGAGTYDRRRTLSHASETRSGGGALAGPTAFAPNAVTEVADSLTYGPIDDLHGVTRAVIQAKNRERPYLRLGGDWVLASDGPDATAELVLDGLWIGASVPATIVLQGRFERVVLRNLTLDPGGMTGDGEAIPSVSLRVDGEVKELVIRRSVLGSVATAPSGLVETLQLEDSVLDASVAGTAALALGHGDVTIERCTVFGPIRVLRLSASALLAASTVYVTDTQAGCFRFSRAAAPSRVPHPFRSVLGGDDRVWFESRVFGAQGYAELSSVAPPEIATGAEGRSEMGAFSAEILPIRSESLQAKVEEHLPFGMVPVLVRET